MAASSFGAPVTNRDWLSWLAQHRSHFNELVRTATATRRTICQRLEPLSPEMPFIPRLQPKRASSLHPALLSKLISAGPGFFYFAGGVGGPHAFYVSTLRREAWGCVVPCVGHMALGLNLAELFVNIFKPLCPQLEEIGIDAGADLPVESIEVKFKHLARGIAKWTILSLVLVSAPARSTKAHKVAHELGSASGSEAPSEAESLQSEDESGVEDELDGFADKEEKNRGWGPPGPR